MFDWLDKGNALKMCGPLGDASDLTCRGHLETLGQRDYKGLE